MPVISSNHAMKGISSNFAGNLLIIVLFSLFVVGCNSGEELAYISHSDPTAKGRISIAHLKSLCRAEHTTITSDCYIEGHITANDLYGEYAQALVIEDESGGIEIGVEGFALFRRYPIGCHLRIFCEGLAVGDSGGKIVLGAPPTGEYTTDRIGERESLWRLHLLEDAPISPSPLKMEIGEARYGWIGRYVEVRECRVAEAETCERWCRYDSLTWESVSTTRHLVDAAGDTLDLFLPSTVIYASEPIPQVALRCCGILDYFNRRFQLRLVNRGYFPEEELNQDGITPCRGNSI